MFKINVKDKEYLLFLITLKGYNKVDFSDAVNVSNGYLSQIINKNRNVSPKLALRIAEVLDKDIEEIFLVEKR